MSPPRRRSSRLASGTPRSKAAAPELPSLNEETPSRIAKPSSLETFTPNRPPGTPVSSAIKPPLDEMHPARVHASTAQPSAALELGFSDIQRDSAAGLSTPTKANNTSPFNFQLSAGAQKMMEQIREQAARYKADIVAQREADREVGEIGDRKIATAKGKSGRFSAAHMAEFKKMDSIQNHASAWRAKNFTPVVDTTAKKLLTPSGADASPAGKRGLKRTLSKANLDETPNSRSRSTLKRGHGAAGLGDQPESPSPRKHANPATIKPHIGLWAPSAKRAKQREGDDASKTRPISRDGSSIPLPGSQSHGFLGRLTSPTKASLAHSGKADVSTIKLVSTPTKSPVKSLAKSASLQNLASPSPRIGDLKRRIITPNRMEKVKHMFRGRKPDQAAAKTTIPAPIFGASLTPMPTKTRGDDKELPPLPLTTPRRRLSKHVSFTPKVTYEPAARGTPTPHRAGILKSWSKPAEDVEYPSLGHIMARTVSDSKPAPQKVGYPDLSSFKAMIESRGRKIGDNTTAAKSTDDAAGSFSFRSDHTIKFGDAFKRFGPSPGHSSIRQVRQSTAVQEMPGSFPDSHPNKENRDLSPAKVLTATFHGMSTKKRSRPSTDEEDADREAEQRAAKKRKNETVAEGPALFGSRNATSSAPNSARKMATPRSQSRTLGSSRTPGRTPSRTPVRTPGSVPSKPVMSLSRLNMLARPKARG